MSDRSCTTLIVGASQAGLQLAASLRQYGDDGSILLVGGEKHAPYQRPPLSKAYLAGKADAGSLSLRTPEWYSTKRIDLLLLPESEHAIAEHPELADRLGDIEALLEPMQGVRGGFGRGFCAAGRREVPDAIEERRDVIDESEPIEPSRTR